MEYFLTYNQTNNQTKKKRVYDANINAVSLINV